MAGREDCELITIPEAECRRLLSEQHVGRLAFVRRGQPLIMPVNYVFDHDCVVFRTDPGAKLANTPFRRVAFEVDAFDFDTRIGWSVLVQGYATEITRHTDPHSEALRRLPVAPFGRGDKAHWIEIRAVTITGRRIA
ncbi:MAG TPA: pyridoxamine 5'-phosphate oxidase family protein [Acidimicrobiia bacterium]|nr:pyridoxamine 5'-phosphate oxidase family protein [Acidimicrobiia bacterium]